MTSARVTDVTTRPAPPGHPGRRGRVDQVRAPVQLFAGRQDPRCPAAETEQVYEALLKRNIEVELQIYENEGHGFSHVENRIDAYLRRNEFLKRTLERA